MSLAVLLIEDSPYDRELTCWALRDAPSPEEAIEIAVAGSWPGARRQLMERTFDLLLLDFDLPGPNGLQALGELSGIDAHPPVVMLTGQKDVGRAVEMLRCGAIEYVSKNGEDWVGDLRATIARVAERGRRGRELAASEAERDARTRRLETAVTTQSAELEELAGRAEEAIVLEGELLAKISEELRMPLEMILGCSEGLESELASATGREGLERIHASTARLERMVALLLELKSLATGTASRRPEWFGLADLAWEVERETRQLADGRPVAIEWSLPGGDAEVEHDRGKIRRIAQELLSNAVKFAPGSRVRATLGVTARGGVMLEVMDDGPGFPAERVAQALEEFRQLDGSMTRDYAGLGLGLGLVKRLVRFLGGSVHVESAVGRGTCVAVFLPPLWLRTGAHEALPDATPAETPGSRIDG
jgi:signal transduction histidine kinase